MSRYALPAKLRTDKPAHETRAEAAPGFDLEFQFSVPISRLSHSGVIFWTNVPAWIFLVQPFFFFLAERPDK